MASIQIVRNKGGQLCLDSSSIHQHNSGEFVDKTRNNKLESPLAIWLSDIKAQTSNSTGEERDKGPARQLHRVRFAAITPLPREKVPSNTERVVEQSVHHSLATSSEYNRAN